jgi:hypothetical protein
MARSSLRAIIFFWTHHELRDDRCTRISLSVATCKAATPLIDRTKLFVPSSRQNLWPMYRELEPNLQNTDTLTSRYEGEAA